MKRDILIIAAIIAVLAILGIYFIYAPKASQIAYGPVDVGGGSIAVEDQLKLDRVVLDATLAVPGFITIHESMTDAPTAIIGTSKYLEAGEYEDLTIMLDIEMTAGYKYITLLHADNGDGVYVTNDDMPVEVNGEVVRPDFVANPE